MNWIKRVFGTKSEEKVNKIIAYPEWNYELDFLKHLHRSKIDSLFNGNPYTKKTFNNLVPNLNNKIQSFIDSDFLRISNFKDILSNEFIAKELKELLKTKKLKVSGKKNELVERVLENFEESEIVNPKIKSRKFSLTTKGKQVVGNYKLKIENEIINFQKEVFDLLFHYEYEKAFHIVKKLYDSYAFSGGDVTDKERTIYLRELDLSGYDDKIDKNINSILCAELATENIFSYNNFKKYDIVEKFYDYLPDFNPKIIGDFLKMPPTGVFRNYANPTVKDKIKMFTHFISWRAHNDIRLMEIKKNEKRKANAIKWLGVKILTCPKTCSLCSQMNNDQLKYTWDKLSKLPKLPRYPGCICEYNSYHKRGY